MKRRHLTAPAAVLLAGITHAAEIHVTNCNDSGAGSLREAILAANVAGPDDIVFDVSCASISLLSDLPAITDSSTRLLGDSAPDALVGPDVILESGGATNGLTIAGAADCVIRGVRVHGFPGWGIGLTTGAANNQIGGPGVREGVVCADNGTGVRIGDMGTVENAVLGSEVFGNAGDGVLIAEGGASNRVGGLGPEGNLIYNNGASGVRLASTMLPVTLNSLEGNTIGTDASGASGLGNAGHGVEIVGLLTDHNDLRSNLILHNDLHGVRVQAADNLVGPLNVISGNGLDGVRIGSGSTVTGNQVASNWIGLDTAGASPLPNAGHGVSVLDAASSTIINENVISGNGLSGVAMFGNSPFHNLVRENWIGLDATGTAVVANGEHGVHLFSVAVDTTIDENVIAGNAGYGIVLGSHCQNNVVQGNRIGTLPDGVGPAGNGMGGILLRAGANLIGGTDPADGNVICANGGWGIEMRSQLVDGVFPVLSGVEVLGNLIGEALDLSPLGNASGGVLLGESVVDNRIGDESSVPGAGNVIRHNGGPGVQVGQGGVTVTPVENKVLTNSIRGNTGVGIRLFAGGNDSLAAPVILSATTTQVDGTNTLFGCGAEVLVQVFYSDDDEGDVFVGETLVTPVESTWTVTGSIPAGVNVVATNTSTCPSRPTEQTSAFSSPKAVGLGTPFCFGDGSGTACPCGNFGGTGEGCANGTGAGALLAASGSASVAADDLVLEGSQLDPGQPGLYFQGDNRVAGGDGAPFGDGLRCVGGGVRRIQVRVANAGGSSSTTVSIVTAGAVSAGDTKHYQLWYRNPSTSPCANGFNLSPGLTIDWLP